MHERTGSPSTRTVQAPHLGAVTITMGGRGKLARSVEDVRDAVAEWVAKPGPMMIGAGFLLGGRGVSGDDCGGEQVHQGETNDRLVVHGNSCDE